MGNTVRRETGFEVDDVTPVNLQEIIDIKLRERPPMDLNESNLEKEDIKPSVIIPGLRNKKKFKKDDDDNVLNRKY